MSVVYMTPDRSRDLVSQAALTCSRRQASQTAAGGDSNPQPSELRCCRAAACLQGAVPAECGGLPPQRNQQLRVDSTATSA